MSRAIQLQIPQPCHEDWKNMRPEDKGRHCAACQKVVVDFTMMSDTEIFQYFSKNSSSVCGRIGNDQLNRKLAPPRPPQKNRGPGWPWVLVGLLATGDEAWSYLSDRDTVLGKMRVQTDKPVKTCTTEVKGAMSVEPDTAIVQTGERHEMTDIPAVVVGAIIGVEVPDTVEKPFAARVSPYDLRTVDSLGAAVDSVISARVAMTRWVIDTVKEIVTDSLAMPGTTPRVAKDREVSEVHIYPNPVLRGASVNLQFTRCMAECRVNLYSISGTLVQTWVFRDGSMLRTLTMPSNIAAGTYVVQVIMKDASGLSDIPSLCSNLLILL